MLKTTVLSLLFGFAAPVAAIPAAPVVSTAPVTFNGSVVLVLRSRIFSLSTEERARLVEERIHKIALERAADTGRIAVVENESASEIVLDDFIIMSVTEKDAKAAGADRRELAAANAAAIRAALGKYRRGYTLKSLVLGFSFALLATAFFILIFRLINRAYHAVEAGLAPWAGRSVKGIKLQEFEIFPAERITEFLEAGLKGLRLLLHLLLIYIYLPILFSFFPWTRGYAEKLFGYVLHPVYSLVTAFLAYIPDLIFVGITIVCVHYFLRLLHAVATEVQSGRISFPGFYPDWALPTFQILRFVTWAFSLVIIFPYLPGSDSPAFKGVSVFLGVLFSLGSSSAIGNAVAGLILTYMRPFKIGDRVKIVDTMGDVTEKGLLITRIKTTKNVNVTIPNAMVLGSHIINYSSLSEKEGLILNTTVTIGYDVPWPKVHELLIAAGAAAEGIMSEPAPFVLQTALNDCSVAYELNAYTDRPEAMARTYSAIHQNIQDQFAAAGVEILSPAYSALRDANAPVLPGSAQAGTQAAFKVNLLKTGG